VVLVADVVVEVDNMNASCQLCHKTTLREIGKTCKLCGMALEDRGKDFCSKKCRTMFIRFKGKNN
jgi:hypothetical protein